MKVLGLILLLVLLGPVEDGRRAWNAGRHEQAWRAWSRAVDEAGDEAPPALLHNLALAALGTGRLLEAEVAAEKAAARGGAAFLPLRDFILGNVAFARGLESERLAARPEAGPPALDAAIARIEQALEHWLRALDARADWSAARRNCERAARRLASLHEKREALRRRSRRTRGGRQRTLQAPGEREASPAPRDRPGSAAGQAAHEPAPQLGELSARQVRGLIEKLASKQQRKRAMREARQRALRARVERDW